MSIRPSPPAELRTHRLILAPLDSADASEMVDVLADPDLYEFTGGDPPTLEELETRYRAQVAGPSDGREVWYNWIIRLAESGVAVGFVQATVIGDTADLAWVVGTKCQGQGFATEAATVMREWLAAQGTVQFAAHVHPHHAASASVAKAVGLLPTPEIDSEGEVVWASSGMAENPRRGDTCGPFLLPLNGGLFD